MRLPSIRWILVILITMPCVAHAQTSTGGTVSATQPFQFTASALYYLLQDDDDYVGPTLSADRGRLHLEVRYNYEDLRTASLWGGATWAGGNRLLWEVTPMAGVIFGRTDGVAPGLEMTLGYWKLEWYSESELVIVYKTHDEGFFYTWSTLSLSPIEVAQIGLVAQRSQTFDGAVAFGRGPFVGGTYRHVSGAFYAFNLGRDDRYFVLEAEVVW